MKHTFQIVTQATGKEDVAAIMAVLTGIKSGSLKNDLKLLNYYHEVPVSYAAKIDAIDGDCVELTVHQAQAAVLGIQKQTLLKSSHFPHGLGVHCYIEYINVRNCMAVVGRFAYATVRAERRNAVRVKIADQVTAMYQAEDQELSGQLRDISVIGLALESTSAAPAGLAENGTVTLNLLGSRVACPAVFVRSVALEHGYLHTFSIELDAKQENVVSQFIYSRQVEIIRELKEHAG